MSSCARAARGDDAGDLLRSREAESGVLAVISGDGGCGAARGRPLGGPTDVACACGLSELRPRTMKPEGSGWRTSIPPAGSRRCRRANWPLDSPSVESTWFEGTAFVNGASEGAGGPRPPTEGRRRRGGTLNARSGPIASVRLSRHVLSWAGKRLRAMSLVLRASGTRIVTRLSSLMHRRRRPAARCRRGTAPGSPARG